MTGRNNGRGGWRWGGMIGGEMTTGDDNDGRMMRPPSMMGWWVDNDTGHQGAQQTMMRMGRWQSGGWGDNNGSGKDNKGGGGMVHCCEQLFAGCMKGCKDGTSTNNDNRDNNNGTMGTTGTGQWEWGWQQGHDGTMGWQGHNDGASGVWEIFCFFQVDFVC